MAATARLPALHPHLTSMPRLSFLLLSAWALPLAADPPADLDLQMVASGLARPVEIRHAGDGTDRLFIVEQAGRIRILDGSSLLPTPFLDITALVDDTAGEQGLLGLAFHPDHATNGQFYVNYTREASPNDRTVIARYSVADDNPNLADPDSALTILEIEQDFANHNGGGLGFGPDGYLYIGMGDGGSGGDPNNRAQSLGSLLGKMLRIDVDGSGGDADCGLLSGYTVPTDNPFFDGSGGDCDEIWSLGLRNPWRWSFDRLTGDLFIGDVGQNAVEEIDFEPWSSNGGLNFGWRCYEGSTVYNLNGCGQPGLYTPPILEYPQVSGSCGSGGSGSVTGGYVYRGSRIVSLQGTYIYADFCTGHVWLATNEGGWTTQVLWDSDLMIATFGEDEGGEIYLAEIGGDLYRLVSPSSIFTDGFEWGDLSVWSTTVSP